jgi:arylsulfatase A-like enzyme
MLPDVPDVRSDVATYLSEIETYDREVGRILAAIDKAGRLDNTLIVITSDNGMPFPRSKATLSEFGTHMPLAIRWPSHVPAGKTVTDFVSHIDIAPTILQAAGVPLPDGVVGRSLLPLASADRPEPKRDRVYLGNERHAYDVRAGNVGYPRRAVRTPDYLYIHNYEPSRWPAGDPEKFGDVDPAGGTKGDSLSKDFLLAHRDEEAYKPFYDAAFAKKPAEELYDLRSDPGEMTNVAADPKYSRIKSDLRADLDRHLAATNDPRASLDQPAPFDEYPRHGGRAAPAQRRTE